VTNPVIHPTWPSTRRTVIAPILLSLFLFSSPNTASVASTADSTAPPGLRTIKGGNTYVGSTEDDVLALLKQNKDYLRTFDAERPQNRERIGDFGYMVTEVTNEQYEAFVTATGAQAPRSWADAAIDAARREFLQSEGAMRVAARESGKPYNRTEFDIDRWWAANYATATWEMPKEDALRPVGYINHSDALAYCAWAGLRLPTEAEFQRAVRGDKKNAYPWGEDWNGEAAATSEMGGLKKGVVVGSLAAGVSSDGLHDLLGNVWEWTDSPYSPFKGFKKATYKLGKGKRQEKLQVEQHEWDANMRVTVGGSFQSPPLAARATTRRQTDRSQRTNALGFRCASTPRVGIDIARSILDLTARRSEAREQGSEYVPETALVSDRWKTRPTQGQDVPAGYEVISGYEYFMWMPIKKLAFADEGKLARASRSEPVQLGFFSTSVPMLEPELPAGTYFISFRGEGDAIVEEDEDGNEALPDPELEGLDNRTANFLFYDATTTQLALTIEVSATNATGIKGLRFDKAKKGEAGSLAFKPANSWTTPTDGSDPVSVVEKHLLLTAHVPSSVPKRNLVFALQMKPDQETAKASGWREQ
jgi:formylglycine-generating enzyme required for sulfatase activity